MSYVQESLISSSDVDSTSSVNDKSFDWFFNRHFFPWIQNMTPGKFINTQQRFSNNVSEFTHSNCIMLSYYSNPKHKESAS